MNLHDIRQAYLAYRNRLLEYESVIGVGFGAKEKKGMATKDLAIIALVNKKLPRQKVPKGQLIPAHFQGVPIDVREARITEKTHLDFLKRNGIPAKQGECNLDHFFLSDRKLHALNLLRIKQRRKAAAPGDEPRDPAIAVYGEIFVIEDDGTLIDDAAGTIDHVAAYDLFRTQFGDHYDFIFFHYDTASGVPDPGNSSPTIYNNITGINHYKGDAYDDRAAWGSTKIQSYQKISGLTQLRRMLHETAHRWCAYVYHQEGGVYSENLHTEFSTPSQAGYHWGTWFDNDSSCMDYDYDDWIDSVTNPGEFEIDSLASGAPGTDEFSYHPLDLYLMGLMSEAEVGTFRYIQNPDDADGDGSYTATQVNLTVTNITDQEGVRSPAYPDTQRVFHQAFILITKDLSGVGTLADAATVLGNFERYRAGFVSAFRTSARSRAMIDGSLLHSNFESLYIRDNTSDTGSASSTGAFWDSPDIWVRNADDGGTTHQDTIRDQDNFVHARVWNSSGEDYDNVTVRIYQANFTGTEFYYPEDWHPDNLIGEAVITVPAGGSAIAKVTWASGLIPDATWHPCLLVEVIPMEVTPELRHHAWDNRKLGQKNINIVDPPGDASTATIEFAFGHPARIKDKTALLTVARTADLPGLELILDPAGLELVLESDLARLPGRAFLPDASKEFRPGTSCHSTDGLSLTFPRETEIIVGSGGCGSSRAAMSVTICAGSKIHVRAIGQTEESGNRLIPVYRDGKQLYRLPRKPVVGLQVPLAGVGRAMMKLHLGLAGIPASARGGLIQILQSDASGRVVGGLNILLRP